MTKKELQERLKEIKYYVQAIQLHVNTLSNEEVKESNYNGSEITQSLLDLLALVSQLAYDNGMD